MQALADVAAADAVAAKGSLHANAGQVKLALRSIVTDAVKRSMQSSAEAPATAQQSVLRHTLAKHGDHGLACLAHATVQSPEGHQVSICSSASATNSHSDRGQSWPEVHSYTACTAAQWQADMVSASVWCRFVTYLLSTVYR